MARITAADVLGATTLIVGPNEFLAERTLDDVRRVVRKEDADADVSELTGADLGPGALAEITSPSLFASLRCVIVRDVEAVPVEGLDQLEAYASAPAPDVALALHHSGGVRGKAVLERVRKTGTREIAAQALKRKELPGWVVSEFRRHKATISEAGAATLVEAIGEDMRALAGAADQLSADAADGQGSDALVRTYFAGRAEVKGFAVADAAIEGKASDALEQLRWAFASGVDPVLITSAVASGLRGLARYMSAPRGLREGDLAREVGAPPWKLRWFAGQSRAWSQKGVAIAIQAAAQADADVKGAAGDRLWPCERLIISVIRARAVH
ncbi:MAG TPA: DNA polymerase III subunit delta [Nocardioidaceae bacterium]|nr:DNA polymerase III subunit delta [Nocardioidaceae bacterium]